MDQKEKNKKIKILMRKDYPFPFLQDLILEILISTRQYNGRALSSRYEKALKVIFGKPRNPKKCSDDHRDTQDAEHALYLMSWYKFKNKKTMSKTAACEEIARRRILGKSYDPFSKISLTSLDDETHTKIKSRARAISRKITERKKLGKSHFTRQMEEMMFEDTDYEEIQMVMDIFESWKKRNNVKGQNTK